MHEFPESKPTEQSPDNELEKRVEKLLPSLRDDLHLSPDGTIQDAVEKYQELEREYGRGSTNASDILGYLSSAEEDLLRELIAQPKDSKNMQGAAGQEAGQDAPEVRYSQEEIESARKFLGRHLLSDENAPWSGIIERYHELEVQLKSPDRRNASDLLGYIGDKEGAIIEAMEKTPQGQ